MSHTTFDALPANSRIWVFSSARDFSPEDRARLDALGTRVMDIWVKKQAMIRGCWELRDDRFLVFGADETAIGLDGCSVDAMMHWIMRLEAESGLTLIDRMSVFYRDSEGAVHSVERGEFRRMLEAGDVTPDTHVFDTTISRIESLRENRFELPMRESWHAKLFLATEPEQVSM